MATAKQMNAYRAIQNQQATRHINRVCEVMGASPVFRAKYRGKCADCGGTGVIKQGNECVLIDGAIYHFECAARAHQLKQPCATCSATGQLLQRGPVSDKKVCVACAVAEAFAK